MTEGDILKLHIGCFDVPLEGWYNTDVSMHIFVARIPFLASLLHSTGFLDEHRYQQHLNGIFRKVHYLNATKRFPLPDHSVEAAYSSHMLYNLSETEAKRCLSEIYRVLQPGGILRLALIDFDALIRSYNPVKPEILLNVLYQPMISGKKNHMQWCYNIHSISSLLSSAGFVSVQQMPYRKGDIADVESIDYRPDSLFVEGMKPL